jgi:hypothetical protein
MARADKALVARRVDDILRIRLDGAEWWDVRDFVREKEGEPGSAWFLADGETPLSDGQIRRYQQRADRLVLQSHERSRKRLFRQHLAKRRSLFGRAVASGDYATALRILDSEAKLAALFPPEKHEHAGKGGAAIILNIKEEIVGRPAPAALAGIVEEVVTRDGSSTDPGPDNPPPPGAARLPPQ